jgi:hypothetical protein
MGICLYCIHNIDFKDIKIEKREKYYGTRKNVYVSIL